VSLVASTDDGLSAILMEVAVGGASSIVIEGLPSSDPGIENALFTDGAPSAGVPKPLMVSGG
jgi:hypothetical protein